MPMIGVPLERQYLPILCDPTYRAPRLPNSSFARTNHRRTRSAELFEARYGGSLPRRRASIRNVESGRRRLTPQVPITQSVHLSSRLRAPQWTPDSTPGRSPVFSAEGRRKKHRVTGGPSLVRWRRPCRPNPSASARIGAYTGPVMPSRTPAARFRMSPTCLHGWSQQPCN